MHAFILFPGQVLCTLPQLHLNRDELLKLRDVLFHCATHHKGWKREKWKNSQVKVSCISSIQRVPPQNRSAPYNHVTFFFNFTSKWIEWKLQWRSADCLRGSLNVLWWLMADGSGSGWCSLGQVLHGKVAAALERRETCTWCKHSPCQSCSSCNQRIPPLLIK